MGEAAPAVARRLQEPCARDEVWSAEVLADYDRALLHGTSFGIVDSAGGCLGFDVRRWTAVPDEADETLLERCVGPTLDLGCGPGRFVTALAARGIPALGVDIAPGAVAMTRAGGGLALRRSVFDPLPGEGRWQVAVLADGNVGIGGDVGGLLTRVRELLAVGGRALIEADPGDCFQSVTAHIHARAGSATFPWVRIGARPLIRVAQACGLAAEDVWTHSARCFVTLRRI